MSLPFSRQHSTTNLSIASKQSSTRATAQEVYDQMYGPGQSRGSVEAALQRIYEPNAMWGPHFSFSRLRYTSLTFTVSSVSYENPLLTATSRAIIADICHAAQQLTEVDMPTPSTLLSSLFGKTDGPREPWFRVLRVWGEVGDICEAESFGLAVDGHRKSIVEHTIHVLILPGIHSGRSGRHMPTASESSLDVVSSSHLYTLPHFQRSSQPSLAVPGTRMAWPSPLHLKLRVLSRLEFNGERVTHHRDFWDVKDLVALVPGAKLAQYVGTRLAARALATVGNLAAWFLGNKRAHVDPEELIQRSSHTADNSLGLLGIEVQSARPDVDLSAV